MRTAFLVLVVTAFYWSDTRTLVGAPAGPTPPDLKIERQIRERLSKSKLNSEHFTVSVRNGVATFEGKTSVLQHKGAANRIAHTSGAVPVRNNIKVSSEAPARAAKNLIPRDKVAATAGV